MKKLLLGCMLMTGMYSAPAQVLSGQQARNVHPAATEVRYDLRSSAPLYIAFSDEAFVSASAGMEALSAVLKCGPADTWKLIRSDRDELGMTHHRYQQYYQQLKVMGGEYIVHEKQGRMVSANGLYLSPLSLATAPALSEQLALRAALSDIGASKYLWQASAEEQEILSGHDHGKGYPKGELVILPSMEQLKTDGHSLCWRFDVYALEPHQRWVVFVDATNGRVVMKEDRICSVTVNGTAFTRYSGTQTMQVDSLSASSYRLRDYSRGSGVETYDLNNGTSYGAAVDFTDTDNIWNTTTNQDNAAYDAHWGTQKTYDYFLGTHGRNSYDNAGAVLKSYIHYSSNYNNAFWNGSVMTYGDGDGATFSPLTEIDIIGHELTHGVTTFSSNLVYSYQSGALNESFSDIFGITIDFFAKPATANFLIGDQTYTPGTPGDALRYMNNPNLGGQPDTYLGTSWYTGSGDNGGVHTNSGVQNFWYYLLCQGGSGTNDNGFAYNVSAIGMNKARMIAYRNNSFYLTSGSQYADAAFYALKSANDLYGNCSPEAYAVKNAWDAVGVYGLLINTAATAALAAPACAGSSLQLTASGGVTFAWTGPNAFSSSLQNPVIPNAGTVNNGTYSCLVTDANGCSGTANVMVAVSATPLVSASGGGTLCNGGSLPLSANASIPGSGGNTGSNATPFAIPDANTTGITSQIPISGSTSANAIVAVQIDSLTHTWDADLKIELISPGGSVITLASGVGGSGDNFIRTRFITGATNIANGAAPFTGNFAPQQAFSGLAGSANGNWGLRVSDLAGQDVGTLWKWSIELPGNVIVSYSWSPSTGLSNATVPNPIASPSQTTTYTVTVSSSSGCTASSGTTVTIGSLNANISGTNVSCFGSNNGTAIMQLIGGSGNPQYSWSNGASTASIGGLQAGTYTCTVTDGSGCSAVRTIQITAPAQLDGFITTQNASCGLNDGLAYLTFSGGTAPYTYLWSNGAITPNISALAPGSYTVTVTDANGCTFVSTAAVGSNGSSTLSTPASITGSKQGVCAGSTKTYSCPVVSGAQAYNWTVPAGALLNSGQGSTSISVTFPAGFISGNVTVYASNTCANSNVKTVTVRSVPNRPGVISGAVKNLCGAVSSYSIAPSTTGATSYNWTVPAGAVILNGQGTTSIQVQWPVALINGASICVTAVNACGNSSARCLNAVTTKPTRPAAISGPASVCANQAGLAFNVVSEPGVTYNWTAPSGAAIVSGQGTASVLVNWGSASGNIKVVAGNSCGSVAAVSKSVSVTCRTSGQTLAEVQLMPNPGTGSALLSFSDEPGDYTLVVTDILGQVILKENTAQRQYRLHLEERSAGIYLVAVRYADGAQKVLRMIIEK